MPAEGLFWLHFFNFPQEGGHQKVHDLLRTSRRDVAVHLYANLVRCTSPRIAGGAILELRFQVGLACGLSMFSLCRGAFIS